MGNINLYLKKIIQINMIIGTDRENVSKINYIILSIHIYVNHSPFATQSPHSHRIILLFCPHKELNPQNLFILTIKGEFCFPTRTLDETLSLTKRQTMKCPTT